MIPRHKFHHSNAIIFSVYFAGSFSLLTDTELVTATLFNADTGFELSHDENEQEDIPLHLHYKMGFDGCAMEYSVLGAVFGTGIEEQCEKVVSRIAGIRRFQQNKKIMVNCYGYSRGGVAALRLALKLGRFPSDLLEVNLVLNDPVPGNSSTAVNCDFFEGTLANQVMNMTMCHNLKAVLSVYSAKPLPAIFFHAPVRPVYPAHTQVEEDVIFGSHGDIDRINSATYPFVASRFIQFMRKQGTRFSSDFLENPALSPKLFARHYDELLLNHSNVLPPEDTVLTRSCHSISKAPILFKRPKNEDEYINHHHRYLKTEKSRGRTVVNIPDELPPAMETVRVLKQLAGEVYDNMTPESQFSPKGKLVTDMMIHFDEILIKGDVENLDQFLTQRFRLLVKIALQRDRHRVSLFSTTKSGLSLKNILTQPKYHYFANKISATPDLAPRYRDLRYYTGIFDAGYFNARNRVRNYDRIRQQLNNKF